MPHLCRSSLASSFASANAVRQYGPNTIIEPIHLDICLAFDDLRNKSVDAQVTVTFAHKGLATVSDKKKLSNITLNAEGFQQVHIEGVAAYSYDGHRIQLRWNTPFEKNEERNVKIKYCVSHPLSGLFFQQEGSIMGAEPCWAITDHETEKARYWLPTVDFPAARSTLSWTIKAPEQYTSLANGALISKETEDGYTTTRWELNFPCPSYLICFAVGDFISVDDEEVDGKQIKYYAPSGFEPADLKRSFGKTPDMIRWLQAKVGVPFPWPKYYQIAVPAIGGAMENISLVTWIETLILDEKNAEEYKQVVDTINVHEMAHTYFGDMLVIRHFEHAWLKESWAQYMESCWLQDKKSEDDFRYGMLTNAQYYFKECSNYMRPIVTRKYDSSWDMFDSHTYPGGAWRIHMLRQLLGDDAFWTATNLYIKEHAMQTVETSDFRRSLEKVSGLNLQRFFDEWLYSKGYPQLSGTFVHSLADGTVQITLSQTQMANDKPLFGFSYEIELTDDKGKTYRPTLVFNQNKTATACIQLEDSSALPMILRLDPDLKILCTVDMSADERVLQNTATDASDILSRIWAYRELIRQGSYSALSFVAKNILKEPFYGVRIEASHHLARTKNAQSLEILAKLLLNETDPLAMSKIASVCSIQDEGIRQAALTRLADAAQLPYRAHVGFLMIVAAQHKAEDLELLLNTAKDENKYGQHGILRGGALKALGYHRSEEAFKYLLGRVAGTIEPLRARVPAIGGLTYSVPWQSERLQKEGLEVLIKLLRDPNFTVRIAAVKGLVQLKAQSAYNEIANSRFMYTHETRAWLDRTLYELRRADPSKSDAALQETVEKLEGRVKELENKLLKQTAQQKEDA
ncbi:peptidase family M1-domain-containing protein [Dichotomocladium elegans]|nr:peptidase family M1-domain-containing protein [Dichotomocladium elegans]